MHAAEVTDRLLCKELLETRASVLLNLIPIYHKHAFTQRERSHVRTQIWRSTHAPLPTHAITDVQKHTQERWAMLVHLGRILLCVTITRGGRNGHRATNCSGTGEDKRNEASGDQGEGAGEVCLGMNEIRFWISLSARSTQQVHKRSLGFFSHFLYVFVLLVLVLLFLFTADLSCFDALRRFGHAQSRENWHLSFFLVNSTPPYWKIERNRHCAVAV